MIYRKSIHVKRLFTNVCWGFPMGMSMLKNCFACHPISGRSIYGEKTFLQLPEIPAKVFSHRYKLTYKKYSFTIFSIVS